MEPLREIRNRLLNGWQLSKMHTFEVAARHQSFALAAEELSLSPSAVSHRINQLEEELGIQLFVRSHRKVELTHEGKRVYWALKSSLDTLNQEILDIKNQELSGTLTLYSRPSIAQCWLVPALGDFTRRYPSISLTVLTGNDNVNLQRAGIDLAIYFDDAPSAQLTHHFLMDEEILPVCSPEYAQRHALTNTVAQIFLIVVQLTGTLISILPLQSQVSQSSSPKHSGQLVNTVSENSPESAPLAPFSIVSLFGTMTQPSGVTGELPDSSFNL